MSLLFASALVGYIAAQVKKHVEWMRVHSEKSHSWYELDWQRGREARLNHELWYEGLSDAQKHQYHLKYPM